MSKLRKYSAIVLAILMVAAAGLHIYWALGGTWFLATALNMEIGEIPSGIILVTWFFVAGLLAAGFTALGRIGLVGRSVPQWIYALIMWGFFVLMALGAIYNFSIPRFWDRWIFAPAFLLLAVLAFIVARREK